MTGSGDMYFTSTRRVFFTGEIVRPPRKPPIASDCAVVSSAGGGSIRLGAPTACEIQAMALPTTPCAGGGWLARLVWLASTDLLIPSASIARHARRRLCKILNCVG